MTPARFIIRAFEYQPTEGALVEQYRASIPLFVFIQSCQGLQYREIKQQTRRTLELSSNQPYLVGASSGYVCDTSVCPATIHSTHNNDVSLHRCWMSG